MTLPISYTRTFSHTDWVDNVDRVQAGGDGGFNGRFHGLEAEFDAIAAIVTQVSTELTGQSDQLSSIQQLLSGVVKSQTVSVPPVLTAIGATGWDTTSPGVAAKPSEAASARGAVPVTLPAGTVITSFRALGTFGAPGAGASLRINLMQQDLTGAGQSAVVAITVKPPGQTPFDLTKSPSIPGIDVVGADSSYFILAQLDEADANADITLTGFQVTYTIR